MLCQLLNISLTSQTPRLRLALIGRGYLYAAVDHRLELRILSMKPEHETRRKIIREWMSLPKDKRLTEEQAKPFAKKAMERIPSSRDSYQGAHESGGTGPENDDVERLRCCRHSPCSLYL